MFPISLWLADYQLLAAALLLGVMLAIAALRQPAQRLAVAKSTLAALAALALLVALPGWSLVHLLSDDAPIAEPAASRTEPTPAFSSTLSTIEPTPDLFHTQPLESPADAVLHVGPRNEVGQVNAIGWLTYPVSAYAIGSAAVTLWLITGALLAHRVSRQATPAPPELQALLQQLCGEEQSPPLLISNQVTAPVALGIRRPTILLPTSTFPIPHSAFNNPPSQLLPILAHELAHLHHRDLHTLAATRLLLILLWPQPLYWLLRRTIRLDQETLADAAAADRAGRLDYAQQLLAWASSASTQRPPRLAGAVGLWEGPSQLKRRIALLLNEQFNVMRSCSRRWRWLSIGCVASIATMLSLVTLQPALDAAEEESSSPSSLAAEPERLSEQENQKNEEASRMKALVSQLSRAPNVFMGYCVDETGQPLAGVDVSLFVYEASTKENVEPIARTKSAADGRFEFNHPIDVAKEFPNGVPEDHFVEPPIKFIAVVAQEKGRTTEFRNDGLHSFAKRGQAAILRMSPSQTLRGRVIDDRGRPVANAVVTTDMNSGGYVPNGKLRARTDAEGRYEMEDLPRFDAAERAREYAAARKRNEPWAMYADPNVLLSVQHSEFATRRANVKTIPGELDVTLIPGATIKGRVVARATLASGAAHPMGNVPVWIMRTRQPVVDANVGFALVEQQRGMTDADGNYTFSSLPASEYAVTSTAPKLTTVGVKGIEVGVGQTATAPDVVLSPGAVVRVKLVDGKTKEPLKMKAGQKGYILPQKISSGSIDAPRMDSQITAFTADAVGETRLAPGRYKLFVSIPGEGLAPNMESHSKDGKPTVEEFEVSEGETLELDVPLFAIPIQSASGVAAIVTPAESVEAEVETQTHPLPATGHFVPLMSPADGEQPGAVPLDADPLGERGIPIEGGADHSLSKPVSANVTAGTTHQSVGMATIQAMPIEPAKHQPNALELHIVDENKQPLAGVEATLYSAASRTGDAKPIKTLATDAAGNVVFASVVPAEQIAKFEKMKAAGEFIAASPESYLVALKRPGQATALVYQSAGELALAGGKRTIMLRPAVKLSGRVTDPEGKPVPGAIVAAGSWSGTRKIDGVNTTTTDADGRYEFADRASFNRATARRQVNAFSFVAAANSPPSQKDPSAPEDPSAAEVSTLVVTHPDFAVTWIEGGDVPGVTDVQMLPAASIVGRVVHNETGAPAAGATVRAMSEPTEPPQIKKEGDVAYFPVPHTHSATTKTDEQGNYRLTNLPAGTYNLWVEVENPLNEPIKLASRGVAGVVAAAGAEPTAAPDSLVGPPPTVTAKLIDAVTGQPLQVDGELVAAPMALRADNPRLQAPSHQRIPISKDGTFSFHVLPGKFRLGVEVVEKPGTDYRVLYRSPDDFHSSASVADFNFGEDISIELPVYPIAQLEQLRSEHAKAYQLLEAKKFDEAIAAFSKMIAEWPDAHEPLSSRCFAYRRAGRYAEAIADAELLLKRFPDNAWSKHMLADLLASSPVEGTRDGKRAMQFAEEVVAMAKADHSDSTSIARYLELVAAAHAELGDFAKAASVQQEAIAQAAADQKAGMETRLELYQADKPFHREAPAPTPTAPAEKPADQGASKSPPLRPLTALAIAAPPATRATGVVFADANPKVGPAPLKSLDLKMPLDSSWRLVPQPAKINLNAAATLGDAIK